MGAKMIDLNLIKLILYKGSFSKTTQYVYINPAQITSISSYDILENEKVAVKTQIETTSKVPLLIDHCVEDTLKLLKQEITLEQLNTKEHENEKNSNTSSTYDNSSDLF